MEKMNYYVLFQQGWTIYQILSHTDCIQDFSPCLNLGLITLHLSTVYIKP